ncbi:MAG: acyltransferase family protein [Oscillospiraceae bacterium]|nr:acyltransferase family protein [Oscillospiraceae bacterium]
MRKYYIDNIRWLCVLLLFPYHTFMMFNAFDESFYVKGADIETTTLIMRAIYPWLMPILFLVAGLSSAYALNKRSPKQYIKERVSKLLLPLVFGILILIPVQTYFAERFHNNYTGNYFEQYILFFTKPTDLSGYNGGFTPAHLWFLAYLFVISLIALPVMYLYQKSVKKLPVHKIPLPVLLLFFLVPGFAQMIFDIAGKSVGEYTTWFLFGYFIISNGKVQEKLEKHRFLLLGLCLPFMIICTFFLKIHETFFNEILFIYVVIYEVIYFFYAWTAILTIFGFAKRYLNFANKTTSYMSASSFGIYVLHQQWTVITAYFALILTASVPLQMVLILTASIVFTFINFEVFKRVPVTRFMFGIKEHKKENAGNEK